MKDFKADTWDSFQKTARGKKVYIWGAGQRGASIANILNAFATEYEFCGFVDKKVKSTPIKCAGFDVYNPCILADLNKNDFVVLISPDCPGKIVKDLEKMHVENYFSYFWLMQDMRDYCYQPDIDMNSIEQVKSIVEDDYSRYVLDEIVAKRRYGALDYTDIKSEGSEYFRDEFFTFVPNEEVFVDAGGFDGDTIEEFIVWTGGQYDKVYTFEPDPHMLNKIKQRIKHWRNIEVCPYGLWESESMREFILDNNVYSSRITVTRGGTPLQCVSLDSFLAGRKCSFIKMDIEGAEIAALHGAYQTIKDNKPKLAICIYHNPNDLWEIPLMIKKWVPEYKLYIRHFGVRYFSTVLFATV